MWESQRIALHQLVYGIVFYHYTCNYEDFTLKKAAELTGQKLALYVTKPTQGKDFNEMLQGLNQSVKRGEGRGHKL